MDKIIVAENSRGLVCQFTETQWSNMVASGHSRKWKILSDDLATVTTDPVNVTEVKEIETIESFGDTYVDIEFRINYRKLLTEAGVKFNPRIKDPAKLKALYDNFKEHETK
jgi:hypothetical protein